MTAITMFFSKPCKISIALQVGGEELIHRSSRLQGDGNTEQEQMNEPSYLACMQDLFMAACSHGNLDPLQILLQHAEDSPLSALLPCHSSPEQQLTSLSVAAISNNPAACRVLIDAGADANQLDGGQRSALHWAVLAGHLSVVKSLLANGSKPDARDSEVYAGRGFVCLRTVDIEMEWANG